MAGLFTILVAAFAAADDSDLKLEHPTRDGS